MLTPSCRFETAAVAVDAEPPQRDLASSDKEDLARHLSRQDLGDAVNHLVTEILEAAPSKEGEERNQVPLGQASPGVVGGRTAVIVIALPTPRIGTDNGIATRAGAAQGVGRRSGAGHSPDKGGCMRSEMGHWVAPMDAVQGRIIG
jgi:hypothetical protein